MRKLGAALAAAVVALVPMLVASPAQAASYTVSASLNKSWMTQGTGVLITGKLTPGTANKTVTIQRFKNAEWVTSTTTKTTSSGKYKAYLNPAQIGTASYRVLTSAKGSHSAGKSKVVNVDVYTWFDLAELATTENSSQMYFDGGGSFGLEIEDQQFGDDAWASNADGVGKTRWALNGVCKKVSGYAGLDESSDTGAIGRLRIYIDGGTNVLNHAYDEDESGTVTKSISNTQVMVIQSYRETEGEAPVVGYGQPRVFCMEELPSAA